MHFAGELSQNERRQMLVKVPEETFGISAVRLRHVSYDHDDGKRIFMSVNQERDGTFLYAYGDTRNVGEFRAASKKINENFKVSCRYFRGAKLN